MSAPPVRTDRDDELIPWARPGSKLMCKAHNRATGKPCGHYAMLGLTVCHMHGGKSPRSVNKARERLMSLRDKAVGTLEEAMDQRESWPTAVTAAKDVLDRTGLKPVEEVNVTGTITIAQIREAIGITDAGSDAG